MKYTRAELIDRLEKIMNDPEESIKQRIKAARSLIKHKQDPGYTAKKVVPVFEGIMEENSAYSIESTNFLISIASINENNFLEFEDDLFD